ncbi:myotubularin-related protein 9-like isoform X2 [Ascaphus truei]|uniref:myotubularin-related protein 9-like isoform X2 n=1 Tax=Ascaphus truei TaxID=8439 RepID=UPI003F5AD38D
MELSELIQTSKVEKVCVSCPLMPPLTGTLCVSSHHLLLSAPPMREVGQEGGAAVQEGGFSEIWLLHRVVDAVEKSVQNMGRYQRRESSGQESESRSGSGTVTLRCKDLRVVQLEIPGMEETLNVARSVQALSSLDAITVSYPFFFRPLGRKLGEGWPRDTTENFYHKIADETDAWRLTQVNTDFGVCPSYPLKVIVPRSCPDDTLRGAATFRHGGRFPVLSYYHRSNKTALLRSAQPLVGSTRRRCEQDEAMLEAVLTGRSCGYIIDTRSAQEAKQSQSLGGGTESEAGYVKWRVLHRRLERGRALQDSLSRLVGACHETTLGMSRWLNRLQAARWMSHVMEALTSVGLTAQCMEREGACVLVHGEQGTDNTLLVTSLSQLVLSPDCRTLAGFQDLIEREWLQGGHPFLLRCAHSAWSRDRPRHEAPLFLLFLDCCWQIGHQFPRSLEFNERFLCRLAAHAYSSECLYEVREMTHSLWDFLNDPTECQQLLNPLYEPNPLVIWPSVEPQSLQLWEGFFLRYLRPPEHTELAWERMVELAGRVNLSDSQTHQS